LLKIRAIKFPGLSGDSQVKKSGVQPHVDQPHVVEFAGVFRIDEMRLVAWEIFRAMATIGESKRLAPQIRPNPLLHGSCLLLCLRSRSDSLERILVEHIEILPVGVELAVLLAGDFADDGVGFQGGECFRRGGSGNPQGAGGFGSADDGLALEMLMETDDGGGFGTEDFAVALVERSAVTISPYPPNFPARSATGR
jgi:hypothetical protein